MAVITSRLDDLTGDPHATTVLLTLNGEGVEIDLAPRNVEKLAKLLAPYFEAGTAGTFTVERKARRRAADRDAERTWDLADLRRWAASNNVELPARGRIPAAIVEQYRRAVAL